MAEREALDDLRDKIQKRVKSFDERRIFYRKGAERTAIFNAAISALTTFLIGVGQIYNLKLLSVIALGTSAMTVVVASIDNFYAYRKRWVDNNYTLMHLYELKADIEYRTELIGNLPEEEVTHFHHRYQSILKRANDAWKEDRLEQS
jgi:hypothetical protein